MPTFSRTLREATFSTRAAATTRGNPTTSKAYRKAAAAASVAIPFPQYAWARV
jgi:hypothetical protein